MQTSNQFPEEPEKAKEGSEAEHLSQPFYEFPVPYTAWPEEKQKAASSEAAVSQPTDAAVLKSPSNVGGHYKPEEDLIRQGLVYPPPPSFYQQAQAAQNQPIPVPPLSTDQGREGTKIVPPQSAGYIPPGAYAPPFAPVPPMQPPAKRSYKWLWISIAILAVLLLGACGFCGWAFAQFFTPIVQSETDVVNVANSYYGALQDNDYAGAYQYLMPQGSIQGMTLATFTQRAQSADNQYGNVHSYTVGTSNIVSSSGTGLNFSRFTVVMTVSRGKQSYSVLLTLQKSGNNWKIIDFDRI
jgi:nitrate reductase NapE component